MDFEISFPHLDKPIATEDLVQKKFRALARRLDARFKIGSVKIIADVTQRKPDGRPAKFSVMIMVHSMKPHRRVVAKKSASDFKKALNESVEAVEKVLRRESQQAKRARKQLTRSQRELRSMKRGELE